MTRLPVFGVFWRAINFTILELPTIIRLTWLPLGLMALVTAASGFAVLDAEIGRIVDGHVPWSPGPPLQPYYEAFAVSHQFSAGILQLIASAAAAVALHKIILLNDRQPGRYFAFPYGWTEILYTCMAILSTLIIALSLIPFFILFAAAGVMPPANRAWLEQGGDIQTHLVAWSDIAQAQAQRLSPVQGAILAVALVTMFVLVLWLTIRMFVWPAAVVARRRLSFAYAWFLTKGNAWAIFGLYLLSLALIFGFTIIVALSIPAAFVSPFQGEPKDGIVLPEQGGTEASADTGRLDASAPQDSDASAHLERGVAAPSAENEIRPRRSELRNISRQVEPQMIDAFWRWFILSQLVAFGFNVLGVAYSVGLISHAYRALSDHDPNNPVDD